MATAPGINPSPRTSTWDRDLSARIAGNFALHRQRSGLSGGALAERCAQLGYPITKTTIFNLESGKKSTITVHELIILSAALRIHPTQLILDMEKFGTTEYLPGVMAPTNEVANWYGGYRWKPTLTVEDHFLRPMFKKLEALNHVGWVLEGVEECINDAMRSTGANLSKTIILVLRRFARLIDKQVSPRDAPMEEFAFPGGTDLRDAWQELEDAALGIDECLVKIVQHNLNSIDNPYRARLIELAMTPGLDRILGNPHTDGAATRWIALAEVLDA